MQNQFIQHNSEVEQQYFPMMYVLIFENQLNLFVFFYDSDFLFGLFVAQSDNLYLLYIKWSPVLLN